MGIYQTLYDLLETYLFGVVEVGTYQELVTISLSAIGTIFVVAIPFILVYKVICLLVGD